MSNVSEKKVTLVRLVRGLLDQQSLAVGALDEVWQSISIAPHSQGFAVEQTMLRWLLKLMSGASKAKGAGAGAGSSSNPELLRRYPVTWEILGRIFKVLPLRNLVKGLTDRKFISVLHHTLDDLAKSSSSNGSNSKSAGNSNTGSHSARSREAKRKRTPPPQPGPPPFDVIELRKSENWIQSAHAMFEALSTLLSRFSDDTDDDDADVTAATPSFGCRYDARVVFPSEAPERAKLVGPMFDICKLARLENACDDGSTKCWGVWMAVPVDIWALSFQGRNDAALLANHALCHTAFGLLLSLGFGRMQYLESISKSDDARSASELWGIRLYEFLLDYVVGPASRDVMIRKTSQVLILIINNIQGHPPNALQILYELAQDCPLPEDEASKTRVHDWMNEVLTLIQPHLLQRDAVTRTKVVTSILSIAVENSTQVGEELLGNITRQFGFHEDQPKSPVWPVLALALKIDPEIIFRDEASLFESLREMLTNMSADGEGDSKFGVQVAEAIVVAFSRRKTLNEFLQVWYEELSRIEEKLRQEDGGAPSMSPWYDQRFRHGAADSSTPARMAEKVMSAKELASFLDWLLEKEDLQVGAALAIANSLATCLGSTEYTDVAGPGILRLVVKSLHAKDMPAPMQALKWPTIAKLIAWLTPEDRDFMWGEVASSLLEPVSSEAERLPNDVPKLRSVMINIASTMIPDGEHFADHIKTITPIILPAGLIRDGKMKQLGDGDLSTLFSWLSSGIHEVPRALSVLHCAGARSFLNQVYQFLVSIVVEAKSNDPTSFSLSSATDYSMPFFRGLLRNQLEIDDIVDQIIAGYATSTDANHPDSEPGRLSLARLLLSVPDDCMSRPQRERILQAVVTALGNVPSEAPISRLETVLSLAAKVTRQFTFYPVFRAPWIHLILDEAANVKQNMHFGQLVGVSKSLSAVMGSASSDEIKAISFPYSVMVFNIIQQMALHYTTSGRDFFGSTKEWIVSPRPNILDNFLTAALIRVDSKLPNIDIGGGYRSSVQLTPPEPASLRHSSKARGALAWFLSMQTLDRETVAGNTALATFSASARSSELRSAALDAARSGHLTGWKGLEFLLRFVPGPDDAALDLLALARDVLPAAAGDVGSWDQIDDHDLRDVVLDCVDAVLLNLDPAAALGYATRLAEKPQYAHFDLELPAVRRAVEHIIGLTNDDGSSLSVASLYNHLIFSARAATSGTVFVELCSLLHLVLGSPARVSQWNIESTLSLSAAMSGDKLTNHFVSSDAGAAASAAVPPKVYEWCCRLVELVVKKHRLRLEGRSHLLVFTLQNMLAVLVGHPYDAQTKGFARAPPPLAAAAGSDQLTTGKDGRYRFWTAHARAYSRVVTAVCEPTAGSAARLVAAGRDNGGGGGGGDGNNNKRRKLNSGHQPQQQLESAADVAKKAIGHRMYLLMAAYAKLLADVGLPKAITDALEPGIHAIFDVMSPGTRGMLSEAIDQQGREILAGLYKRYRQGKWSGK